MSATVIEAYVTAATAFWNCEERGNTKWAARWEWRLDQLTEELKNRAGLRDAEFEDIGCNKPRHDRVRITCEYQCVNPEGISEGWRTYVITAKATFLGPLELRVTGKDYYGSKDFLRDCFIQALTSEAPPYPWEKVNG